MVAFDTLPADAREFVQDLQTENTRLARIIALKDEQIKLLNFRLFGPKSEKLSSAQIPLLLGEISLSAAEVQTEADRPEAEKQNLPPRAKRPRPNHPGREKLPEHLERREEIIACHPEDCRCEQCGVELPVIGYETREELACEPAKFWVRVLKREKRGSHCLEEQGVVTAPAPAQIVPKGKLSNEFIIEVLAQKYQQHTPVYRQQAVLADNHGIELSRKTLTDALLAAGSLLRPVVAAQKAELFAGGYLQADETTMPCQTPEKTGRNHKAYLWEYSAPGGVVIFDFRMGRGRDGPAAFLKGFVGTLQSDGYGAYDDLGEGIMYAGCMSHARRGFVDAAKVTPLDPLPAEVIARFGELYAVEKEARQRRLDAEARQALRQQKSVAVMAALKERLVTIRQQRPPAGTLAKACDYTLGQWHRLETFLKDGRIEIDNNWCEGAIRPLALGRKNWLHIGSEAAGPKVAAIASIVETCRRLDIHLRKYLNDVLPRLGQWPINRVAELTPTAWKAAQKS
ncbi:MAG TPA: IS66 family transposase [Anaerolineales bacterium]|jgi:transposase